ncbi:MAG TPA: alpha/beta hydrolase [Pyrinomonadaceae bacterium]|nr:alpha/beta hydrolase [Pyrinomonadaceae bacterium]
MKVTGRLKQAYVASRVSHHHSKALSKFVTVEDVRLHFVIKGAGRPVVLIHGNPGSCGDWTRLYSPIASRYQAIAFDRPGHGHSDRPNHRNITAEVQANLLHAALAELGIERPILVGHSWGGALAMIYALIYPESLSGAVLLAPAVYESEDGVSFLTKLPAMPVVGDVMNFLFTPLLGAWVVRTDLQKAFAPDRVPGNYLRAVLSEWTRPKKVKWYSVDDALLNDCLRKFSPRYSDIRVPTAIVTGDSDLIVPVEENSRRLHEALPKSHLSVLPATGHQIPFTRPRAVVDAIDHIAAQTAGLESGGVGQSLGPQPAVFGAVARP